MNSRVKKIQIHEISKAPCGVTLYSTFSTEKQNPNCKRIISFMEKNIQLASEFKRKNSTFLMYLGFSVPAGIPPNLAPFLFMPH